MRIRNTNNFNDFDALTPISFSNNISPRMTNHYSKIHSHTSRKSKNKRSITSIQNITQNNTLLIDNQDHNKSTLTHGFQDHQNLKKPPVVKQSLRSNQTQNYQQHSFSNRDLDKTSITFEPEKINANALITSKNVNITNNKEHLSPRTVNSSNSLSPKVSTYSKINENKNMVDKLRETCPNDSFNKNFFSQFLTKADFFNFMNPGSFEKLELDDKQLNQIKTKSKTISNLNTENSTFQRGIESNNFQNNKKKGFDNELNIKNYQKKLDSNNHNQFTNLKSKINNNNGNFVLLDIDQKTQLKAQSREPGQQKKQSLNDNFVKASKDNLGNLLNSKINHKHEKVENDPLTKPSVPEFLNKTITSSSTQNLKPKNEFYNFSGVSIIPSVVLSTQTEDKLKNAADKNQMMNTILDLKNRVHEKGLEILELKNSKLKYDMENQALLHQMKDIMVNNKNLEEAIDKMKRIHINQEKDIEYLKVISMLEIFTIH